MKQLVAVLITLTLQVVSAFSQSNWQWQNPPIPVDNFHSTYFIGNTGWVVGGGTILKSTDEGNNWFPIVRSFQVPLLSVQFVDVNTGWVVGGYLGGYGGIVKKTTNGGMNWATQITIPNALRSVCFVNDELGWAVGTNGTILKTTDGGVNWRSIPSNTTNEFGSVFFLNNLSGWIVGNSGTIMKTSDGGENWIIQESGTFPDLNSVQFKDNNIGWAVGRGGTILSTSNGGINWTLQNNIYVEDLHSVFFLDNNNGWAAGDVGTILYTSDGGSNWAVQSRGIFGAFRSVFFKDLNKGWMVGLGGELILTTNGGNNWTPFLYLGNYNLLASIDVKGVDSAWTVGTNGTILMTSNGGTNWVAQESGVSKTLYSVLFIDNKTGWIVGDSGIILKSTNSGNNWTIQTSGTNRALYSVCFNENREFWAVGASGTILRSTTEGAEWSAINSGTGNTLNDVYFADSAHGWIVGDRRVMLKTTNGGSTWTTSYMEELCTTLFAHHLELTSIMFIDENTGMVTGNWIGSTIHEIGRYGIIVKTTNGGDNWNCLYGTHYPSYTPTLNSILYLNSEIAWVSGRSGLLYTTSAGDNWISSPINGAYIYSIGFANTSTGWVVGSSGSILKTTNGGGIISFSDDCLITGPSNVEIGSTNNLYESNIRGGFWTLSNYGNTSASFASSHGNDSVLIDAGNSGGHFVLYYNIADSVLCSKHVYVNDPQPVELSSFSYERNEHNVNLMWVTAFEIDNAKFEIQRSSTEVPWTAIGFVPGAGNSTEPRSYTFEDRNLSSGIYNYRLKQIDFNGNFEYFDLPEAVTIGVPDKFFVDQNYPNPFNPATTIAFGIPEAGNVTLKIFDMTGREIKTLLNEFKDAGYYVAKFDGSSLASGTYIYRIESGSFVSAKKMILLK